MTTPTYGIRGRFRMFVANVLPEPDPEHLDPSNHRIWFGPKETLYLGRSDQDAFDAMVMKLANDESRGGPHRRHIARLLRRAVWEALDEGSAEVGLDYLDGQLAGGVRRWTVYAPFEGTIGSLDRLEVGRCVISTNAPPEPDATPELAIDPPAISTSVEAFDLRSAMAVARRDRNQALSILSLHTRLLPWTETSNVVCVTDDGESYAYGGTAVRLHPWPILDEDTGALKPPWRELSDAAAKASKARTHLEQRLLGAARMRFQAILTSAPDVRLRDAFSALDALLVDGDTSGSKIAHQTAKILYNPSLVDDLKALYRARNRMVHAGTGMHKNMDADKVAVMAHECIRRVAWHLVPDHGDVNDPCRTLEDLDDCLS